MPSSLDGCEPSERVRYEERHEGIDLHRAVRDEHDRHDPITAAENQNPRNPRKDARRVPIDDRKNRI